MTSSPPITAHLADLVQHAEVVHALAGLGPAPPPLGLGLGGCRAQALGAGAPGLEALAAVAAVGADVAVPQLVPGPRHVLALLQH